MPHPRGRRLMRRQIGGQILVPAGLTNVNNGDKSNTTSLTNLQNDALYSSDGITPTFTDGSTTLLSDSIAEANWALLGYAGETTANTSGFLKTGTPHYYLPYPGATPIVKTDTTPVLIYTKDGPQSKYDPYYLPSTAQVIGTGSLTWAASNISQSVGTQQKLMVYIAGAVPSASGDTNAAITVYTGSAFDKPLLTFSSSVAIAQSASVPTASLGGLRVVFSSSAGTYNQNVFYAGAVIYITGSN